MVAASVTLLTRPYPEGRVAAMSTFSDFIEWAGSQARASELLDLSEAQVSRLANGKRGITPAVALRIEQVSEGRFAKEAFIWPESSEAA